MTLSDRFFHTGEINLHYVEGPQAGPALVLVHGATGNWEAWSSLIPSLAERWHVYTLDIRGHGQSGWAADLDGYHLSAYVRDVSAFLRGQVAQPAVLVGHSWGAVTALTAAGGLADLLRAVVLVDPGLGLQRSAPATSGFLTYFAWVREQMLVDPSPEALAQVMIASGKRPGITYEQALAWAKVKSVMDPAFIEALTTRPVAGGVDFPAALRAIACPTLLCHGSPERGSAMEPQDVALVRDHVRHLEVFHCEQAGHDPQLDCRDEVIARINALLPLLA